MVWVAVLVGSLLPQVATTARAVHCGPEGGSSCSDIGGVPAGDDCTINTVINCTANLVVDIPGNLTITAGNGIDCGGNVGNPGTPGFSLTLNVGGDLLLQGFLLANGGTGQAGASGVVAGNGAAGGAGGAIDIDVCGTVTLEGTSGILAQGGAGGSGGAGAGNGMGGAGNVGGPGGSINIDADLSLTQDPDSTVDAGGGAGGAGGAGGTSGGNGGAGANAGVGGTVDIFSCETTINGIVGAGGGAGGTGGAGGGAAGDGGNGSNGANAGTVNIESGSNLVIGATASVAANGGNEGTFGIGNPNGGDVGVGGNGGTVTTNNCPEFTTDIADPTVIEVNGGTNGGSAGTITQLTDAPCCPCAIEIQKQVAADDNCDGTADGAFSDLEEQPDGQCVVYRICVTNTSGTGAGVDDRPQVIEDVLVDDNDLGISDEDFGDLAPGAEECRLIPSQTPATNCPGPSGDTSDDNCLCEDVEGINTAVVDSALCAVDGSDACDNTDPPPNPGPDSICEDTAEVRCISPCSVIIDKKVAPDVTCDGTPDSAFVDNVVQNVGECVIYQICVTNTGSQTLNAAGVQVSDAHLGIVNLNFGTINPGAPAVCMLVPTQAPATNCPNGTCLCQNVIGTNTAVITSAICEESQQDACTQPGSDCNDDAMVDCIGQCPLDHFKCYRAKTETTFTPRTVTLADQFEDTTADVMRPSRFCNPADKNDEGIIDPTAHLMCYDIRQGGTFTRRHVRVNNQFGEQELIVTRPFSLCNPATKDLIPSDLNLDHFKCYRVRRAHGSPVISETVTVVDQFETRTSQVFKPHLLCNPVDKNGSGIEFPACHLTCYRLRSSPPPLTPQAVVVEDQFARQDLNALRGVCGKVDYLCVPSTKTVLP
jgi:hypothetical protein